MIYNLERFIRAQDDTHSGYATALTEVKGGHKRSHWIWYVFPQLKSLGHSPSSEYYGIANLEEAKAYLADPTLGARLREITQALLDVDGLSARGIFGGTDAMKVRSSMTLFDAIAPDDVFAAVINKYFDGYRDSRTLDILY